MKLAGFLLLPLLAIDPNCEHYSPDLKPGQEEAFQIVWKDTYNLNYQPPTVVWVEGSYLTCSEGRGWTAVIDGKELCVAGLTFLEKNESQVAWPAGTTKISATAYAHELCHIWGYYHGDIDYGHKGPCFVSGGLVEQANKKLVEKGL
jgi:hypothetical protein